MEYRAGNVQRFRPFLNYTMGGQRRIGKESCLWRPVTFLREVSTPSRNTYSITESNYFLIEDAIPYDPLESLCDSQISEPVPPGWPHVLGAGPTAGGGTGAVTGDDENPGSPGLDRVRSPGTPPRPPQPDNEQPSDGGAGGLQMPPPKDQPSNNDPPPRRSHRLEAIEKTSDASSKDTLSKPKGAPSPKPTPKPRRTGRQKTSTPSDDEDDDDDDIVVLAYSDICSQSPEERQRLEDEIVIKVEQDEACAPQGLKSADNADTSSGAM